MGDAVVCADGRLDDELVAVLEPKLQDALNQPTRREILRVLHGKERACGVAEVLHQLHPLTRAEVSYHVQVLKEPAAVVADGSRPGPRRDNASTSSSESQASTSSRRSPNCLQACLSRTTPSQDR